MKKTVSLLLVMVLLAVAAWTFIDKKQQTTADGVEVPLTVMQKGELAPQLNLQTTAGDTFSLQALHGKKVVLNFWASWCPPCREEMPALQSYYDDFQDEHNVEVIAINLASRDQNRERVAKFIEQYRLTLPMPLDTEGLAADRYRVVTIPTTYMIDTNGRVQHQIQGPVDERMLQQYVQSMD